jgi:acetylornithine deacetylase/succinyl-diaminopimelate desuccinylase-like protein
MGAGAHTREEYVEIDSLLPGLKVAAELILHHF